MREVGADAQPSVEWMIAAKRQLLDVEGFHFVNLGAVEILRILHERSFDKSEIVLITLIVNNSSYAHFCFVVDIPRSTPHHRRSRPYLPHVCGQARLFSGDGTQTGAADGQQPGFQM